MYCVYRHIRKDKNEPFYIGVCNNNRNYKRAYSLEGRNKIWNDIATKTEFEVEILFEDESKEVISEKEKEFISIYGKICDSTGTLANLENGGYTGYEGITAREISCYDDEGNLVETFSSGVKACTKYNVSSGNLHDAIHHNGKFSIAGHQWRYGSEPKIKPHKTKRERKIGQYDKKTNNLIKTFNSISEAGRFHNCSIGSIAEVCKYYETGLGKRYSVKGFVWKYQD